MTSLMNLHQEDQRTTTEDLSEEELAVFDLLTRHEPHLTVPERDEVKIAVKRLLETLKQEKLVLDWPETDTVESRSQRDR